MVAMEVRTNALNVYKRRGETPLECLKRLQRAYPELAKESLTYAGRLDPLAEGVLLVLVGEEAKRKDLYLDLKKTYRFQVLFGFSTDTYDVAGTLDSVADLRVPHIELMELISKLPGSWEEPYPPYSSKPVLGRPLFQWAREGKLSEIDIPLHTVCVYKSMLRHSESVTGAQVLEEVKQALRLLTGDFRQEDIRASWEEVLRLRSSNLYDLATIEIECSRGTYVRSIAHDLGQALNIPALAYHIVRTSVGFYNLEDAIRLEEF